MSDYQAQFDKHVAEASSAVANHALELTTILPGLQTSHVRRVFANISKMLGYVDRREAKHPEYLASTPLNLPERAVEVVSSVKSSFDSGTAHFVQNVLPSLVDIEKRLMEAVGTAAFNVTEIRNQQIKAIDRLQTLAFTLYNKTQASAEGAQKAATQAAEGMKAIGEILSAATTDSQKVGEIRKLSEKLSRGNAGQNPLEQLVRLARKRDEELEAIKTKAMQSAQAASSSAAKADEYKIHSLTALSSLQESDKEADNILRNATQAGLAGAYKTERDKLAKEQNKFALAFYGIILSIIVYAAIFLLPIFKNMIGENGEHLVSAEDSALMLFVRLAILAPAIWALIFTNRRFTNLETLQMDYAAKASTALAYHGYSEEMESDSELSKRLKDGLVLRFLEHPSRLLGKKEEVNRSISGPQGVTYEATSATPKPTNDDLPVAAE